MLLNLHVRSAVGLHILDLPEAPDRYPTAAGPTLPAPFSFPP